MRGPRREGRVKRLAAALVLVLAGVAGALAAAKVFRGRGLLTGGPGMNRAPTAEPGSSAVLPRPYDGAPPLIPHGLAGLSVTRASNDCMGCHLEGVELGEGHTATRIPASHRLNPFTKQVQEDGVVGTRYQCLQCHVPQDAAARPPVAQSP